MKRLSVVAPAVVFLTMRKKGWAQTATLIQNQIPIGIAPSQGEAFDQRMELALGKTAVEASRAFTITAPPQVSVVVNSVTAISSAADVSAFFSGTSTGFGSSPVGLSQQPAFTTDGRTDVVYSFYLFQDANVIRTRSQLSDPSCFCRQGAEGLAGTARARLLLEHAQDI